MNSKTKGNNFEREICKKLSLWLSYGKDDDLFWRTSSSGGRFTQRLKKGLNTKNQAGDITSTSPQSDFFSRKYLIECKCYKDINIWSLFNDMEIKNSVSWWWNVNNSKAIEINKVLILIIRQNFKKDIMLTGNEFPDIIQPIAYFFVKKIKVYDFNSIIQSDPSIFLENK